MPILKCTKREKFAQGVAAGKTQADAYREANPNCVERKWKDETIWSKASEWMADGKVAERVDELKAGAAERHKITVDDLIGELDEARTVALTAGPSPQSSAAVAATMGKAKLLGYDKQMVELTGKDGAPIQVETVDLSALTVAELKTMKALLEKTGAGS